MALSWDKHEWGWWIRCGCLALIALNDAAPVFFSERYGYRQFVHFGRWRFRLEW